MNNENSRLHKQMCTGADLLQRFLSDCKHVGFQIPSGTVLSLMRQISDKTYYPHHNAPFQKPEPEILNEKKEFEDGSSVALGFFALLDSLSGRTGK